MSTLYWAIYPADYPNPSAGAIIQEQVRRGVFGNDTAPGASGAFTGTVINGFPDTQLRLAAVWLGTNGASNVVVSDAFRAPGTLHWAIYPATGDDPIASEITGETVPDGVFGTDAAPVFDEGFTGTEIAGLSPSTEYKLAAVWSGNGDSNVVISEAFTTTGGGPTPPTPPFFTGTVPVVDGGSVSYVHQGVPFTVDGRVCVDVDGVVSHYHNGMRFTSAGRLAVSGGVVRIGGKVYDYEVGGSVVGHFQGLSVE